MERRQHADLHETQTGSGRERERGARPGPAQRARERASREGGGQRRGAARRPRDLRIKAIEASKVWVGVGLSFLEAAPKQPPCAETQTFFCHSEARGRHLRPAFGACPTRRRYRPPAFPAALLYAVGAPQAAAPRPGPEHGQVRGELRRSLGGPGVLPCPAPPGAPLRRPRARASHVVHPALYSSDREAPSGLEEGRAERAGGEVVREGSQEFGQEAQEDGAAG